MDEVWKLLPGYDKPYEVSNTGMIRCGDFYYTPHIGNNGYKHLVLYKDGRKKDVLLHRLVAQMYVENPNNYKVVNHIDENKCNNNATNLEWCTVQYNATYGNATRLKYTSVCQTNKDGETICVWRSMKDAAETLNINYQGIVRVCQGQRKTHGGFGWKYYKGCKGNRQMM